ncbi:histidine phosphotransferase [Methylocapsa aurea]|uniref:histidine phosphotransferase n=1 Tax=Methylocapsa aurea TaxID=663610 RepID=UPI0012EC0250|nr:histidine phosphotransferase [Methylocapsa aurea]
MKRPCRETGASDAKEMEISCSERETPDLALDFAYLARQTFGDADLEAELLRAFQSQAASILQQLQGRQPMTARQKADFAHLLQGSARAIGAIRVGQAAEIFETHSAGAGPAADAALRELAAAIGEASDLIAVTLAKPSFEGRLAPPVVDRA